MDAGSSTGILYIYGSNLGLPDARFKSASQVLVGMDPGAVAAATVTKRCTGVALLLML